MIDYKHRCVDRECPFVGQVTGKSCRCHIDERGMVKLHVAMLERIVEVASQLDMLLVEEDGDVGDICETEDALHEALKPWRAAQCSSAIKTGDDRVSKD